MRAAVMRNSKLVVDHVPDPEPQEGEVLVKTLACGICGSDLHALKHADKMVEIARETGALFVLDITRDIVMGHEFCAEVVDYGPNTGGAVRAGDRVVSMPILFRGGRMEGVGYSNEAPGGYGELMTLSSAMVLAVPNGLATEHAALTEPMAVGVHAVNKARMESHDAPLVIGCGPVGLAVIAALKLRGVEPIVAADFSPLRRALAERMGAHVVVNPAERRAIDAFNEAANMRPAVIFECVGIPGLLHQVMREAPLGARIVVAGVCMEDDLIKPMLGINKELNLQFVLGYTPEEFAQTLQAIADGRIDVAPMITGRVGVDGVPGAFDTLAKPDTHAKILVEPWRT
ncbi:MAG: zinc-binding dehydrogenase [Deltaproteobacteria bacterium]|nr:zinc-binding dehydrogenase [Deltaproteobacteria bacterium]MBI3389921.1 zinc-binding dehydrogenase [Deltaproteobacteria bacterium]